MKLNKWSLFFAKKKEDNFFSSLLIVYIYVPIIWGIVNSTTAISFIFVYLGYGTIIMLIFLNSSVIRKDVFIFLMAFLMILFFNYLVVSYRNYVLSEGLQAFVGISIPCLCVTHKAFDLDLFLFRWRKFAYFNFPLVLLSIALARMNILHYSFFSAFCVPNIFILTFEFLSGKRKGIGHYLIAVTNILIIFFLGGRVDAIVSVCMLIFSVIYSNRMKKWKKIILLHILLISTFLIIVNYNDLLMWINDVLSKYGFFSRNISLLISQQANKELYLTQRDVIYALCIDYIKARMGLPGGFGVPLYLSSGSFYYAHNFILQFFIYFGIYGTIALLLAITVRLSSIKKRISKESAQLLWFMLGTYILIGMFGSSVFIHYLSTIFIALFFFGIKNFYIFQTEKEP